MKTCIDFLETLGEKDSNLESIRAMALDITDRSYSQCADTLASRHPGLEEQINKWVHSRIRTVQLVTNFPAALGLSLSGCDTYLVSKISLASAYFDCFVHFVDDIKDVQIAQVELFHIASMALQRGISTCHSICVSEWQALSSFPDMLAHYLEETGIGERHLWRHHGRIVAYDELDMEMLAKRGAVARIPGSILCLSRGDKGQLTRYESAADGIVVALQLIDDLVDWREDLRNEIYTMPIVAAFKLVGSLSEDAIGSVIWNADIAATILGIAEQQIDSARRSLTAAGAELASGLLRVEHRLIADTLEQVRMLQDKPVHERNADVEYRIDLEKILMPRLQH